MTYRRTVSFAGFGIEADGQPHLNPRHRAHLARKQVVDGHTPVGHALVVGVAAERLECRAALLDAVGVGIGSVPAAISSAMAAAHGSGMRAQVKSRSRARQRRLASSNILYRFMA